MSPRYLTGYFVEYRIGFSSILQYTGTINKIYKKKEIEKVCSFCFSCFLILCPLNNFNVSPPQNQ